MGGLLIVNPRASGVTEALAEQVAQALPGSLEIVSTERGGHAGEIALAHEREVDAIYVFSGDGTYNEVLNGVVGDVPLGFVPGGGTSVLPRALGLSRDPVRAARSLAGATTRRTNCPRRWPMPTRPRCRRKGWTVSEPTGAAAPMTVDGGADHRGRSRQVGA